MLISQSHYELDETQHVNGSTEAEVEIYSAVSFRKMKTLGFFVLAIFTAWPKEAHCFCGSGGLHGDLTRAVVKSSDWLKSYYRNGTSFMTPSLASSIIVCLRLYGHHPDTLLSEVTNNRSQSITETLKTYLDDQNRKHGSLAKIPPAELALIIQGAIAVCQNPRDFHGHDLFATLGLGMKTFKASPTFNNYFRYALTIIAHCNGGVDISGEAVDVLLRGAKKRFSAEPVHQVDITAAVLIALSCVAADPSRTRLRTRHLTRNLGLEIRAAKARLAWQLITSQNHATGDFGNQYSTALGVEALLAARINPNFWYCEKAMRNILSYQDDKGSFGTVHANIRITPALLGETMTSLKHLSCPSPTPAPPKRKTNITVSINLNFNDTRIEPAVNVTVVEGTTAHDILELAKKQNPCYTAVYKRKSWGHSVTSICGVTRIPLASMYWMIYVDGSLAQYGIDGLKPKHGQLITFKYQKVDI